MLDLDAYFARIGYTGPRDSTLATLRALHALHPAAIPFENLDPLLGKPVSLAIDDLQDKMLARRRGGYCFEHNTLFRTVLEALGFSVTGLAARVVWMAPPDRPPGTRTHMLLHTAIDGEDWISDVGFGGLLQNGPLRLIESVEQQTPSGSMRYLHSGNDWTLEAHLAGVWQRAYVFTLDPQFEADYAVGNWYTSTHPNSLFRNHLMAERLLPHVRISLSNRKLTHRFEDGRTERRIIEQSADFWRVITQDFGIDPPDAALSLFESLPPA